MVDELIKEISELNTYDSKTLGERFIKHQEEFGEFSAEVAKLIGISHKPYDRDHLVEEMADALQNVFSIYDHVTKIDSTITMAEVFETMKVKNQKWRSKIPEYTRLKKRIV